ncbi:MAG: hypothetical protein HC872_02545 [Gammaproteobacteria bacterium]|nr:hypothetical protein [Gammaproteobacteria bacterium]
MRLLSEAKPAPVAVSFDIRGPRAKCNVSWPLRLGFLPGNPAEELITRIRKDWPANEQSRPIALGREQANCDVLVHVGTTRTLLMTLLEQQASIKANVLLLRAGESGDWAEASSRLASTLSEVRGSGYVLIRDEGAEDDLARALNLFIAEISHAQPFDTAISRSLAVTFAGRQRVDLIAGFTPSLAAFTLPKLAQTMNRRIKAMPAGSEIDLSGLGSSHEWLTRGVRGGGHRGGEPMPAAAPRARIDTSRRAA